MQKLSKEYLLSILNYDPESGFFTWKKRQGSNRSNNVFNSRFPGKRAGSLLTSKKSKTSYIAIKFNGKSYKAHRLAFIIMTGSAPEEVDHIDHDGTNNKWENLRASSSKDNSRNLPMQKSNKSGCIGVNWHKAAKKWQARAVDADGNRIDLGRYDDIEDAKKARKAHEIKFKYYQYRENV